MFLRLSGPPGSPDFEQPVAAMDVDYIHQLLHLKFRVEFPLIKDLETWWTHSHRTLPFLHLVWVDPEGDEQNSVSFEQCHTAQIATTTEYSSPQAVTVALDLVFSKPSRSFPGSSGW